MIKDEIIEAWKIAGATPYYGCKTRHDRTPDCPCDENDNCTLSEFIGIRLPVENAEILAKFAELILASQEQPTPSQSVDELYEALRISNKIYLFEKLGKCAEREILLKALSSTTKPQPTSQDVMDAVLAEREACAKVCLDHSEDFNDPFPLVSASKHILARHERE